MDTARPAHPSSLGMLARTVTKILRFGRASSGSNLSVEDDEGFDKLKLPRNIDDYSAVLSDPSSNGNGDNAQKQKPCSINRDALLGKLFAGISAVKASYAQLQVGQSPYDPETIQSADQAVVAELKCLSELKQSYYSNKKLQQQLPDEPPQLALTAQIQEQQNLLKTYKITARKLESDLQHKDSDIGSLRAALLESEKQNRSLEAQIRPNRSLAALDRLHLSGLNPTHFLTALRHTVKSVRTFVRRMGKEMEAAGWDTDAAAGAIHPGILSRRPGHAVLAFESYVCQMMFSDFQHRDFSLGSLEGLSGWGRDRFFDEFREESSRPAGELAGLQSPLGKFCRVKYLLLVHPKMESAFFGDLETRELVRSGSGGLPDGSAFFTAFLEMARRVWLLHCLFFSFGPGEEVSVFQVRRGCRFSEMYMESTTANEEGEWLGVRPTVGFTVVPGFRVGRTVIQCKVYLSPPPVGNRS